MRLWYFWLPGVMRVEERAACVNALVVRVGVGRWDG